MKDFYYPGTETDMSYDTVLSLTYNHMPMAVTVYFIAPTNSIAVIPHHINDFTQSPDEKPAYTLEEREAFYKASRLGIRNVFGKEREDAYKVDKISKELATIYNGDEKVRFLGMPYEQDSFVLLNNSFEKAYTNDKGFSFKEARAFCKSTITPTEGDE